MRHKLIYVFLLVSMLAGQTKAQDLPAEVVTKDLVIYRVKMATTFVVPAGNREIDEVCVWHALPTLRPWSKVSTKFGASDVKWSSAGLQLYRKEHDSHHVFWEKTGELKPETKLEFISEFTVRSAHRDLLPGKVKVQWEHYDQPATDPAAKVNPVLAKNLHPEIAAAADKIKKSHPPAQAVLEFSKWIEKTIKYDATVSYPPSDVASTVKNCRGHCGHQYVLFEQFCARAGIPVRGVVGLNLYQPNGRGDLQAIRADWTNIHTWAEVYFPGIGWIEVEPSTGEKAYAIPASWVQNDKWFQNYAIWIREKGQRKIATWTYKDGKFTSDYGVEHIITYSEDKARGQDDPKQLLPAEGVWKLRWDGLLDGELKDASEAGGQKMTVRNNRIIMNAGAIIGEIVDGKVPIVTLRQDDPRGFIAFYTGKRTKEGYIVGTWFNTAGQSGDFELILEK